MRLKGTKSPDTIAIYEKTNRMVDKLSRIGFIVITEAAPFLYYFPVAIYAYFIYFTTDFGRGAFVIPNAVW